MSTDKKSKLAKIKVAMDDIYKLCEKHLDLEDKRLYELPEVEFILGVTQIIYEDQMVKEGRAIPMAYIMPTEEDDTTNKTFH